MKFNLCEYFSSRQQAPPQSIVVVVAGVLVLEPADRPLVLHQDPLPGHGHVLLTEHLLEQDPARTIGDPVTHLLQIIVSRYHVVIHVNILVLPPQPINLVTGAASSPDHRVVEHDSEQLVSTGDNDEHQPFYKFSAISCR